MAIFGPRAATPNRFGSLQVQTSELGVVIPYAAGSVKLPIKLLDYQGFTSTGQSAGKGGGDISSYDYHAALDAALCTGPIDGFGNVYTATGSGSSVATVETYTIPSGGGTYTSHYNTTEQDEGVTYQASVTYTANDYGSDGSQTITAMQAVPMQKVASGDSLAAGQYSVTQDNNVTNTNQGVITNSGGNLHWSFSAADAGKVVSITYSYTNDTTNYVSPAAQYGISPMLGTHAGTTWGYMQAKYPANAIAYPGIARMVCTSFDLGSAATPPNLNLEVLNARGMAFGGGVADCDPAAVITDICTDPVVGMNWPYLADLGVTTHFAASYSNFCVANSLFQSPSYDSQRKALDVLKEITDLSNAEAVWSGDALKIVPYGDSTAVAYGRTFIPSTQPVYSLGDGDFIAGDGQEAVLTSWEDLADNFNSIQFQYTRRDDNYNIAILNDKDEASILMNGLLPMKTVTGDNYRETSYAAVAMNMLLKRSCVPLRQYRFKLKWWYVLLEPMDIVLLEPLGSIPVRIVSINEEDDYSLTVVAEDFRFGSGTGVLYPKGTSVGTAPAGTAQPGDTTLLSAFQPITRVTGGPSQLWLALTGGQDWGGCDVYLSVDGQTYDLIGTQQGAARGGTLTSAFAAGSDPDTMNILKVAISGTLSTVTQAAADAFTTLSLVGGEFIAYETATLTGAANGLNDYSLGGYIRRGLFSTGSQSHAAGDRFVRLDSQIFKYTLDPSLLGRTVYLKFVSFNLLGAQYQAIENVSAVQVGLTMTPYATTMTVSASANADGLTATVSIYQGTVGTAGTATLDSGVTVTLPAQSFPSENLSTWYGVNYNTASNAYVLYTNQNAWLADQSTMIGVGSVETPA